MLLITDRLYEFLERKQILEIEDPLKGKRHLLLPHYHRETAAMLMKDTELDRIVQIDKKFQTKVGVLTQHYEHVKQERSKMSRQTI